jgi:hypothetical protein
LSCSVGVGGVVAGGGVSGDGCGGGVVVIYCGGERSSWSQFPGGGDLVVVGERCPGVPRDSVVEEVLRFANSLPNLLVLGGLSCCGGGGSGCCGGCGGGGAGFGR